MIKKNFLIFLCIGSFIISERKKLRNNENLQILRVRGSQREAWEGFHRSKSTGRRKVVASFEEPFTTGLMWKAAPIIRANAQKKKNAAKPIATS